MHSSQYNVTLDLIKSFIFATLMDVKTYGFICGGGSNIEHYNFNLYLKNVSVGISVFFSETHYIVGVFSMRVRANDYWLKKAGWTLPLY